MSAPGSQTPLGQHTESDRPAARPPDDDLTALRSVIVGPERRDIDAITSRLNDRRSRADDLAEVLPQALLRHTQDPQFARALAPPIEKALTTSVQRNPKPLADALFPVMGPAIRKAVAAAMAGMVESLNRTLEHSLSWRSFEWRMEGWRTGKSFAEVVLAKTLVYRVEQVFLIERKAGLLLAHVHAPNLDVPDADMVSGLLTAIRDFAHDSFKMRPDQSLEALQVGDVAVWIEAGPAAMIAAVIRGAAPPAFRRTLQEAVESIHLQFADALANFSGDTSPFADAESTLSGCLDTVYQADERRSRSKGAWILLGTAAVVLLVLAGLWYRDVRRFHTFVTRLRAEPGVVVVTTGREGLSHVVSGLRDPLARDPGALLVGTGLTPERVIGRWTPYQALEPSLILARAQTMLQPPPGSALVLEDDVLSADGNPPRSWVEETVKLAPFVPGVTRFDARRTLQPALRAAIAAVEEPIVLFVKGTSVFEAGQTEILARLTEDVRELSALADVAGVRYRLDVSGHTDADGPDDRNAALSQARAAVVAEAVGGDLVALRVSTRGAGSSEPAEIGQDEDANRRNRRAVVRVVDDTPAR